MKITQILIAGALLFSSAPAAAESAESFAEARRMAATQHKPILIEFHREG